MTRPGTNLKPLLLKRFPNATQENLREAYGYAYGGAIIQDLGYYPHGSIFFSDLARYRKLLRDWDEGHLKLPNNNFDVGEPTGPGKYHMNDDTYAELLVRLAKRKFANVSGEMRAELIAFFSDPNAAHATKRKHKLWSKVEQDLQLLKATSGSAPLTNRAAP